MSEPYCREMACHLSFIPYTWAKHSIRLIQKLTAIYFNTHGHDYARLNVSNLSRHLEYADDVDFFCDVENDVNPTITIAKSVLAKNNLFMNVTKTRITENSKGTDLKKVKKLGTFLDESAELSEKQFGLTRCRNMARFEGINLYRRPRKWRLIRSMWDL